jgi:hypothetical protein
VGLHEQTRGATLEELSVRRASIAAEAAIHGFNQTRP